MTIESLATALPKEQARVRVILGHYKELGPVGAFGAAFIERDLQLADDAAASGDVVAMIAAYQNLKQTEG
jgi:hypothetical protein